MTPNQFRDLALSFPEAIESAHMQHPDFRVGGKVFATLGYPDEQSAMVKLSADDQKEFVRNNPGVFKPVKGAWGRQGATNINLPQATIEIVREAITAAWRRTAPKRLLKNL
ncbi:MAG TPA: MmcQ/YjbR family DNA-binding protein [Candidatus Udaeobacter sp.]